MRIVELITFLSAGGAERFIVDLSNQLAKNHDVYLVTILDDKKDSEIRNFYRSEISKDVYYRNLGIPNGFNISSQWKVLKYIKKLRPDVIHVHLIPTLKYGALAIGYLSLITKVYFSVHNDLHNGYDKGLFKLFCNTLGLIKRFRLSCLSNKNYNDFKAYYPYLTIKCIDNGRAPISATSLFDSVKNEMDKYRSNKNSILLIHIARCHPVKNQMLLVNAVNTLISEGRNVDLVIIGAGFDSTDGEVIKSTACNRIHFLGTRKNIGDYMLNADIFCLSSDYEGMPITLLEAGLAGVPAVSTPVCGSVDLIHDGINGFLSPTHNLEDYVVTLDKAIDNYETIKANAVEFKANSPYTIELCAKKFVNYFND